MTKLTATDILELLAKASKLRIQYAVYDHKEKNEYIILFEVDWYADEHETYSCQRVIISKDNQSKWGTCWDFDSFMLQLDEKLKEQEQKKSKAQKRKELIDSLTPEQRELLGV